ncbi:hypothetical protein TNCV_523691 [Trichonephila clavipes]|nr:hypothetical protein TNCV_523691 [Trichonephila clavipes]
MRAKAYCVYLSLRNLGIGVHVQMFRSSGQSDAKSPVFSSQASLVDIYRQTETDEWLSRPCPAQDLNSGPVLKGCARGRVRHAWKVCEVQGRTPRERRTTGFRGGSKGGGLSHTTYCPPCHS